MIPTPPSASPRVQALSAELSVAPQLSLPDMAWAAQKGFRSVINNRPDFEEGAHQPTSASLGNAAHAAGLQYAYLPVAPGLQSAQEIAQFAALLESLPKPILAFCRSGTRSSQLYRAASSG
jgi:uncharacterized protein (TIGR01244 family)